jgi:hypothetical protein
MPSIINSSTSSGLITTGSTDGSLALQTGGTTALTISSAQVVNFVNSFTVAGSPLASSAMTLITTTTASASSSVDFTGLSATYKNYVVMITNCVLSVSNEYLAIRTSIDNGSTFVSAAASYAYRNMKSQQSAVSSVGSESSTYMGATVSFYTSNTANNGGINGSITIANPSNASATNMYGTFSSWESTTMGLITFSGVTISTSGAVNAVRFYPLSGNITSGTFKLYGIS